MKQNVLNPMAHKRCMKPTSIISHSLFAIMKGSHWKCQLGNVTHPCSFHSKLPPTPEQVCKYFFAIYKPVVCQARDKGETWHTSSLVGQKREERINIFFSAINHFRSVLIHNYLMKTTLRLYEYWWEYVVCLHNFHEDVIREL